MTAYSSFGTLLSVDDGGGVSFTTIGAVRDISGPAMTTDTEDATTHSSAGGFAETLPTLRHAGEVTFDILFDPSDATHDGTTGLLSLQASRAKRSFRMAMPTNPAKRWNFQGYITGVSIAAPVSGMLTASITITITSQPTIS
jgi:hypothetical protein